MCSKMNFRFCVNAEAVAFLGHLDAAFDVAAFPAALLLVVSDLVIPDVYFACYFTLLTVLSISLSLCYRCYHPVMQVSPF